jgi:glycosyltransferase involved in cell wall biosynthesis
MDFGTGIQRVVKNIASRLVEQSAAGAAPAVTLIQCESGADFLPAELGPGTKRKRTGARDDADRIVFSGNDRILMLDSSWQYHAAQSRALRAARMRGAEVVTTLYDLVPIHVPGFCDPGMPGVFAKWLRQALGYSTGFVCISRSVADELLAILKAIRFPHRMKVGYWHLGADFSNAPVAEAPGRKLRPMFLTVGTVEPRKGHRVILDAFTLLWREGLTVDLVIAGKGGWGTENLQREMRAHVEYGDRLKWFEKIDDAGLQQLYTSCDALIAASHTEGFGLPIVEAGHYGKPVIASRIPVFEEVAGMIPGATFFEAGSPAALAAAVRSFLDAPATTLGAGHGTKTGGWLSWSESAAVLRDIVINDKWYQTYEPGPGDRAEFSTGIGQIEMLRNIEPAMRRSRIELVEGPVASKNGKGLRYIVRVTNLSDVLWSSEGSGDDEGGIYLGCEVVLPDGGRMAVDAPRIPIPFVLAPGDSLVAAVEVKSEWIQRGGRFADIRVMQAGFAWWDPVLRLQLV